MKRIMLAALVVAALALPASAQATPPGPYPPNTVWHQQFSASDYYHIGNAENSAANETAAFYQYNPTWTFPFWDFGDYWGMGHQPPGTYWIGTTLSARETGNIVDPVVAIYSPTLRRECVYTNTRANGSDVNHWFSNGPHRAWCGNY